MNKKEKVVFLKEKAKELRKTALTMIHGAQSGHPGGSLSAADFMAALYFDELNIRPEEPRWIDRDRFVLSKGHVCPILYSALALREYFPYETIFTLRKQGSILQGHPDMKVCPGVDISTGSLGQGFSTAVGMAIAAKRDGRDYRVFCLVGDGECDEGQIWEAVMTAVKYKLDNLILIVDNNNLQNDNTCDVVMPTGDLKKKFEAFGCEAMGIDGHAMEEIVDAFDKVRNSKNGIPKVIVGKCVKGKGVSFMENVVMWHGMAPNDEQFKQALTEVEAMV
ncbi:transketolase [Oceanispirochaeta crateris]|uniref:Transketolase n=1 Tax=Oceanispirochaeta crateris TaxID=2518645 RepID=A0A5C1QPU3_9SPIO|nr:transketolase [Oceanispirochaeta crateris]QEN08142.1 transketolase [Oceanispirochaeta crateris]